VVINGSTKDLTENQWSDVNFVTATTSGAVAGTNTMKVYDVADNITTTTLTLV
jgi:hypothetical protein